MIDSRRIFIVAAATFSAGIALGQASGACAQSFPSDNTNSGSNAIDSSSYNRGQNEGVRDMPRPDYQAVGLHLGGFMVYPKVNTSAAYDDNIFAVNHGAVGDFIFSESPEIDITSTWSRNAVSAYVKAQQDWYLDHAGEDATQYAAGAAGRFDFGQSTLSLGVDSGEYVLPRAASNNIGLSAHRIPYNVTAANVQLAHAFTRLRLSARVDYQIYGYENGTTTDGLRIQEDEQNRNILTYQAKAEFAMSPDTALYVVAAGNNRNYQFGVGHPGVIADRDSSGYDIDVGANFDITHLVRGEIQVGYLHQDFVSKSFRALEGLSALGQIEWFPSQMTTVTARIQRTIGDSGLIGSAGFLATQGTLQIDQELRRNLILTANGWISHDEFNGVNRTDNDYGAGVSANWLLTRSAGLTFAYTYADWKSTGAGHGIPFADNRISVTAVLQY